VSFGTLRFGCPFPTVISPAANRYISKVSFKLYFNILKNKTQLPKLPIFTFVKGSEVAHKHSSSHVY